MEDSSWQKHGAEVGQMGVSLLWQGPVPTELPVQGENIPSWGEGGWMLQAWGSGCSTVMPWVVEMAHTHCCLLQQAPVQLSIQAVTIPDAVLHTDFPRPSQKKREGIWERIGSCCQCAPVDGVRTVASSWCSQPAHPGHG